MAVAFAGAALVVSHDDLTADWFSDEMWRANFIRSPHWWRLYRSWDTPTPPLFIGIFRAVAVVLPSGPLALRLYVLAALVGGLLVVYRLLVELGDRPPTTSDAERRSLRLAAFAACVTLPLLSAFGTQRIFTPYFFETALGAALVLGVARLEEHPRVWPWLLAGIAITPLVSIGTLFLLPATVWYTLAWARRQGDRRRRVAWTIGAGAMAAIGGAVTYAVFYRPVAKASIDQYWAGSVLTDAGEFRPLLVKTIRLLREGLLGWSHPHATGGLWVWGPLAACGAVGLFTLVRRWPPFAVFLGTGWLSIVAASAVAGWPMTPERVNLPVFVFVDVAVVFGAVRLAALVSRQRVVVTAAVSIAVLAFSWPRTETPLFGEAFLRGLTPDLHLLRDSPSRDNLVLAYHFSTRWYVEDALITPSPGGRHYEMLAETYTDRSVYDPAVVAEAIDALPKGAVVWCVMPYDIGPDATERACPVGTGLTPFVDRRGERTVIRGFRVP